VSAAVAPEIVQALDEGQAKATPGAMLQTLRREIPGLGLVEFEEAPRGWLTKKGEPRQKPWRAYHFTPEHPTADAALGAVYTGRTRLPSTTTLLDEVCPKPGLPPWAEARGIEGLLLGIQNGQIDPGKLTPEQAIEAVRKLKLGADAAKLRDAERGLNVHAINERYMLTGEVPKLSERPEHHRGYIKAWIKCMLELKLEPVEVEQLVVHPEDGYAGRLDLRARNAGVLETIDFKTQRNAGIYAQAHYQVKLYERAAVRCGAEPAENCRVIVLAENGEWDHMIADHDEWRIDAALAHYRGKKPIESLCDSRNRAQKEARAEQ
jgi:hypothetical protein